MPLYDFRCPECRSTREVRVDSARVGSIELVCTGCGGSMRKVFSAAISVLTRGAATSPPPFRSRRQGPTCSEGAVRLDRPNPFRTELPAAPTSGGERNG